MRVYLPLILLAAACGPTSNATLSDLPNLRVDVQLVSQIDSDADRTSPQQVSIDLGYDDEAFRASHDGECAVLADAEATLLGNTYSLDFEGSDYESTDCMPPRFRETMMLAAHADTTRIDIIDHTRTIAAVYPADAFEPRIATLTSHAAWSFHGGDMVTLEWSHPADLDTAVKVQWHRDDGRGFALEGVMVDGPSITGAIPAGQGVDGDGDLDVTIGEAGSNVRAGTAVSCSGASRCAYSLYRAYDHSAHLAP